MFDKPTKAQKAANSKKKLTVEEVSTSSRSIVSVKKEMAQNDPRFLLRGNALFPLRYAVAGFCALVLLIFVSVLFSDEGVVLQWIVSGISGLFGRNFYYISIPALIYTIFMLLFSRNQLVRGRFFSILWFMFLFGCASHLIAAPELSETGIARLGELWKTGILGTSGGLICGLLTDLLVMAFGRFFVGSMLLILCAVCLMIGAKLDLVGWTRTLWAFCVGNSWIGKSPARKPLRKTTKSPWRMRSPASGTACGTASPASGRKSRNVSSWSPLPPPPGSAPAK